MRRGAAQIAADATLPGHQQSNRPDNLWRLHPTTAHSLRPDGFTLVELVAIVLIVGILAAVAAPRLIGNAAEASESALRQTLVVVRDAIDLYANQNGGLLPAADGSQTTLKSDLAPYLRGQFPRNPLKGNATVGVETSGVPLGFQPGPLGWRYDNQSGQFIANSNGVSGDGVTRYWEF